MTGFVCLIGWVFVVVVVVGGGGGGGVGGFAGFVVIVVSQDITNSMWLIGLKALTN